MTECSGKIRRDSGISHHVLSLAVGEEQLRLLAPKTAAASILSVIVTNVCMTSEQVGMKLDTNPTGLHCAVTAGD